MILTETTPFQESEQTDLGSLWCWQDVKYIIWQRRMVLGCGYFIVMGSDWILKLFPILTFHIHEVTDATVPNWQSVIHTIPQTLQSLRGVRHSRRLLLRDLERRLQGISHEWLSIKRADGQSSEGHGSACKRCDSFSVRDWSLGNCFPPAPSPPTLRE